ncbi:hypothetical protein AG4045_004085 [Apium graveolens]|uniref:Bifunctional inhibitor/plant lipid transfer protein/seed storage helical domain-containing protein n=1 Tax=Apium graveolens TaxID=4045 RepID=A0A6L5BC05_APIGR|nr:hypothetical protein AG4045_004085 [Apium graveolens]
MASKYMTVASTIILFIYFVEFGSAEIEKDKNQCQKQLFVLGPCLPYVQGGTKTPTLDCCAAVKQVLQKSKVCLCVLIKDRDDLTLRFKINATLALGLPERCNAPSSVSECPGKENGTSDGSSSAAVKSDGGVENKRLGLEMAFGLVLFAFLLISPFQCLI